MNKQKIYAVFMKEMYVVLVFAFGGALFYYLATGRKTALWIMCAVFVLYSIWHTLEFRREQREKANKHFQDISLPERVDDFAVPRYVYQNGVECKKPNSKNGRIIGYRIGPSLVISAKISDANNKLQRNEVSAHIACDGGKLLNHDEANVLRYYWDTLDEMRCAVGDGPLPTPYFWYQDKSSVESGHYREDFNKINPHCSAIIFKL